MISFEQIFDRTFTKKLILSTEKWNEFFYLESITTNLYGHKVIKWFAAF